MLLLLSCLELMRVFNTMNCWVLFLSRPFTSLNARFVRPIEDPKAVITCFRSLRTSAPSESVDDGVDDVPNDKNSNSSLVVPK